MLVATLVGRERLLQTYELAKAEGYRFYSYGDAMLLL
jgi:S-adenosylmethionine:tRNA ribosyltransferase-isomerase